MSDNGVKKANSISDVANSTGQPDDWQVDESKKVIALPSPNVSMQIKTELEGKIRTLESSLETVTNALSVAQESSANDRQEKEQYVAKIKDLERTLESMQDDICKISREHDNICKIYENEQAQRILSEETLEKIKAEHERIELEYSELEVKHEKMKNELDSERAEHSDTKTALEELKLKQTDPNITAELERYKQENASLREDNEDLRFSEMITQGADDVKEEFSDPFIQKDKEAIELTLEAIMERKVIKEINADYSTIAYMDRTTNSIQIIYKYCHWVPDFVISNFIKKNASLFDGGYPEDEEIDWLRNYAFVEATNRNMKKIVADAYSRSEEASNSDRSSAEWKALTEYLNKIDFEIRPHSAKQEHMIKLMTEQLDMHANYGSSDVTIKGKGKIGVFLWGRLNDIPLGVSYVGDIEKGESTESELARDQPIDTPRIRKKINGVLENMDDKLFDWIQSVKIKNFAHNLEQKFSELPLLEAINEAHERTFEQIEELSDLLLICYDEDSLKPENLKKYRAGTNPAMFENTDLHRLMTDKKEADYEKKIKEALPLKLAGNYLFVDITAGNELVGRVFAFKEKNKFRYSERSSLETLGRNLSRMLTQHYKKMKELRFSFSKQCSQEVIRREMNFDELKSEHASVLFSDVCGFTKASEQLGPRDIGKIINILFENTRKVSDSLYIMHDKTIGDCTMDIVGPPFFDGTPESYAKRGVECLLQYRELLQDLNTEYFRNHTYLKDNGFSETAINYLLDNPVGLSLGIATTTENAKLDFGKIGSTVSPDFTVLGRTANLAARIQSKAGRNRILVCPETFRLLTGHDPKEGLPEKEEENEESDYFAVLGQVRKKKQIEHKSFISRDGRYVLTFAEEEHLKNVAEPQILYRVERNPHYSPHK